MRGFAAWVMRSRTHAISATALAMFLAQIFAPLALVSFAVVALTTLRVGVRDGGLVLLGGFTLTSAVVALFVSLGVFPISFEAAIWSLSKYLYVWVPVWLLASFLRVTRSMPKTVCLAGGFSALAIGVLYLATGNPVTMWLENWTQFFSMLEQADPQLDQTMVDQQVQALAHMSTSVMATSLFYLFALTLFLARWWQALLYNPGGFQGEFHQLRAPVMLVVVAAILMVTTFLPVGIVAQVANDILLLLSSVFMLFGLALVHAYVKAKNGHKGWLIAVYVALILPFGGAVVSMLGAADTVLDLRRRFTPLGQGAGNSPRD